MGLLKSQCTVGVSGGVVQWQRVTDPGFGTGDAYELDTGQLPTANDYGYIVPRNDVIAPVGDSVLRAKIRTPYQAVTDIPGGQLVQRAPYFGTKVNAVVAHEDFGAGWTAFAAPEDDSYAYGHLWAKSNGLNSFFHHYQWLDSNFNRIRNRLMVDTPWGIGIVGDLLMPASVPADPGYAGLVANPPQNLVPGQIVRFNDVQFEPISPSDVPGFVDFPQQGVPFQLIPGVLTPGNWFTALSVHPRWTTADIDGLVANAMRYNGTHGYADGITHRIPYRVPEATRWVVQAKFSRAATYPRFFGVGVMKTDANTIGVVVDWYQGGDVAIRNPLDFSVIQSQVMSGWTTNDIVEIKMDCTFSPSMNISTYIQLNGGGWQAGPTHSDPNLDWGGTAPVPVVFGRDNGTLAAGWSLLELIITWY